MTPGVVWDVPWLAAAALPAGAAVALLARRGLRRARGGFAWGASLARGAAVAAACVAAAGPSTVTDVPRRGAVLVATNGFRVPDGADRVVRWPDDAPDAAAALELARAAAPGDRPAALALAWTPARDAPPSLDTADALRSRGAPTSMLRATHAPSAPPRPPAPRLVVPSSATEGVEFAVVLDAGDAPFDGGTATFSVDGVEQVVPLVRGARRVTTPPVAVRAGTHVLAARFGDRPPCAATIRVAEPPTVLVLTSSGVETPLARRLRAQGLRVTVTSDSAADLAERADVVVLGAGTGVRSADDVASRVAAGAGLLVAGGPDDRGLSRLRGTALEPLLPVELPLPPEPEPPAPEPPPETPPPPRPDAPKPVLDEGERRALRIALLLVVDRSGSMAAGSKLAMAREAALAAARTLAPDDRVGVIAFDDRPEWVVPFQDARDAGGIHRRLQALRADGGTNILPALRAGYAAIGEEDCAIRHVVLLTDGQSPKSVWSDVLGPGVERGITLSAIGVGGDADHEEVGLLAQLGRGRSYRAVDPDRLPQVVTLDTRRFALRRRDEAQRAAEVPDLPTTAADAPDTPPVDADPAPPPAPKPAAAAPRVPRVVLPLPFLAGLEHAAWPALLHPETVVPRGAATAPLAWDDGGAAVVLGRASGARCAVVGADVVSADARELWTWPDASRALAQLVRTLAPTPPPADDGPRVEIAALDDGRAAVVVHAPGGGALRLRAADGGDELRVTCRPSGEVSVGELDAMPAAGVWRGAFAAHAGAAERTVVAASAGPVSRDDAERAAEIAARAGAPVVDALPPPPPGTPTERREDRSPPFLVGAALLLVVDAALRRGART